MSTNPPPELQSLFDAALNEFDRRAGTKLLQHQVIDSLAHCQCADSVMDVLQAEAKAFRTFRGDGCKLMVCLKRTVHVLHTISNSGVLCEGIGLHFQVIFAGISILLSAITDISASYDALLELFESFDSFLGRLEIHTRLPSTMAMTETLVKILVELLSTISLAIEQAKQGRLKKLGKKILGENDVEAALARLDRLTQEEARTTVAQTFEIVHGLMKNVKTVMEDGQISTDGIRQSLVSIQKLTEEVNKSRRDQLQQMIRVWLSPPDPSINYNTARMACHKGTAEWFIHGKMFLQWKRDDGSLLWIHGKPGSGKSLLSSAIIDDVTQLRKAGLATAAFFYFDFKDASKKAVRSALSSLAIQLAAQSDDYSNILSALHSEHDSGSKQPSEDALKECLRNMFALPGQPPIFIVLDALDECPSNVDMPSPRENALELVEWLDGLNSSRLHVCVTSRPEVDIMEVLYPLASHTVSLHDESGQKEDIANYIKDAVNSDRRMGKWRKEDRELVIDVLSKRADGMFRWVYCQLDTLRRCLPPRIQTALYELPLTLDGTYERTLQEIDKEKFQYAYRLLQCIAVACRPLHVEELAEFLAFDFEAGGCPELRKDWRSEDPRETVLSTCSTLISIVDTNGSESPLVQFSHFSVLEYLTSKRIQERVPQYYVPSEPAHLVVTQACLSVLLQLGDHATKAHVRDFPLARYAARHWVDHAKPESVLSQTKDEMKRIFDPKGPYFAAWIWICDVDSSHGDIPLASMPETPPPPKATPLYYAARCGFHDIADWLLTTRSQDVMAHGGHFGTPFYASSAQCHHKVVEVLLKHKPAAANAQGIAGWVPLHAVAMFGSLDVSRVLIEFGADVNAKHPFQLITPLLLATRNGHTEVVRLLLEKGADPKAYDEVGRSPLYRALEGGHTKITQLLLDHGAHPDTLNEDGETLLHIAPVFDDLKVVEGLLDLQADVNVIDNQGQTPYQIATEWKRSKITELLLEHGARVTSRPPSIHAQ